MDVFQTLLWDLGELINQPLHVDKNRACKLLLNETIEVQLEMDTYEERLLIVAFIAEIPLGKFRENVLKEGLKMNSTYHPCGVFAYLEKKSTLILRKYLHVSNLSSEKLLKHLEVFVEEAEEWHIALNNGQTSPDKYKRPASPPVPQ